MRKPAVPDARNAAQAPGAIPGRSPRTAGPRPAPGPAEQLGRRPRGEHDVPQLTAFIAERFTKRAFRLETLDAYDVGSDGEDVARYLRGEASPDPERKEPWLAQLRVEVAWFEWRLDGQADDAMAFFEFADGVITRVTDFWPEPYEPPPGREHLVERW
jgi:hypothetical protein